MDVQITDTQVVVNGKLMLDLLDNKVTSSAQLERIAQQFIKSRYPDASREEIIRTGEGREALDAYLASVGDFKRAVYSRLRLKIEAIRYVKNQRDLAAMLILLAGVEAVEVIPAIASIPATEEAEEVPGVDEVPAIEAIPPMPPMIQGELGEITNPVHTTTVQFIADLRDLIDSAADETLALVALRAD